MGSPEQDSLKDLSPSDATAQIENEKQPKGIWGRIKYFFIGEKLDRKRLTALGKPDKLKLLYGALGND